MGFFSFLAPLFGSKSGALTGFTNRVASKAVGGSNSLTDAFIKAGSGGVVDSLTFAKDSAVEGIHDLGNKVSAEVSRIPLIGEGLAAEVNKATGMVKGALESIPTTPDQVMATPEAKEAEARIVSAASKLPFMQIR